MPYRKSEKAVRSVLNWINCRITRNNGILSFESAAVVYDDVPKSNLILLMFGVTVKDIGLEKSKMVE